MLLLLRHVLHFFCSKDHEDRHDGISRELQEALATKKELETVGRMNVDDTIHHADCLSTECVLAVCCKVYVGSSLQQNKSLERSYEDSR